MSGKQLWFIPGEGIERTVITSNIQRYLGNDATVKPGIGPQEFENAPGYWITAFRNLTSSQVEDLRTSSMRYRQEQARKQAPIAAQPRHPRDHVPAYSSHPGYDPPSYHTQPSGGRLGRPGGESPNGMDTAGYPVGPPRPNDRYGLPPQQTHRMPNMDVDMDDLYGQPPAHRRFDDEPRRFGDARLFEPERAPYHDTRQPYGADPSYGYRPQSGPGPGPYPPPEPRLGPGLDYSRADARVGAPYAGNGPVGGFGRQAEAPFGFPPTTSAPPNSHMQQPPYGVSGAYQPPAVAPPIRLDGRDGRDNRFNPLGDYPGDSNNSRYAAHPSYPSPPDTIVGLREGMPNTPSPSGYVGPGQNTLSSQYNFDSRTGPPMSSGTYAPLGGGAYHTGNSPSSLNNRLPATRDTADDGERPPRRMRHV